MKITKANFALAKTVKSTLEEESMLYALHISDKHTEITNGKFAIRMAHSPQEEFEFAPTPILDVCLHPDDAVNIASSLGKDESIKAVIPSEDQVQIEFESGEIRILKKLVNKFPSIASAQPASPIAFSIAVDPEFLIAALQAFRAKEVSSVLIEFRGSESAICLRPALSLNPSSPEVSALLMPMIMEGTVDIPGTRSQPSRQSPDKQISEEGLKLQ